jgi:hypothetical protein
MDEEELAGMEMMGKAIATMALRNSVDAINEVFGHGKAKIDTPLVAAVFAAHSQMLSSMLTAASFANMEQGDDDDEDDDDLDLMFNS